MSFENSPEPNLEKREESPEERKLEEWEIEQLREGMKENAEELKIWINEIREELEEKTDEKKRAELEEKLKELQTEYENQIDFVDAIALGGFEEITEGPIDEQEI